MADRPIIFPRLWARQGNNRFEQFGGQSGYPDNHGSAPWSVGVAGGGTLVTLTSGLLNPIVTDGVLACGLCQEASAASAAPNPPTNRRNPSLHLPWNLRGVLFLINVSDASGHVGAANSAPQLSAVTIGARYAMIRPTSGTYSGYQMLDSSDTTNVLFEVVDKPSIIDGVTNVAATYNGLVVARIIPTLLQVV